MIRARIQIIPKYVADLRQVTGLYLGYIENTLADNAENYYELIKDDSAVAHAMHLLSLMVAGEYFEIKSENKLLAEIITFALKNLKDFTHARKSLVSGAVLFGLGIMKKTWKSVEYKGLCWTVPDRLKEIDRRRMRIERCPENRNIMYWTIWDPKIDSYVILEDRAKVPKAQIAVQDYIWFIHEHEEMAPYFRGMGEILFKLVYIKDKILNYWADLCESWAKPFLVAIMDAAAGAVTAALGGGMATATERTNKMIEVFEKMRARHVGVIDKKDKIEIHERGSIGNNILQQFLDYLDKKIELLILGAELTTSAPSVGSYALGQLHRGATQSIVAYNRTRLEEVLEQELIWEFLYKNRINLFALGMKFPKMTEYSLEIRAESEEIRKLAIQQGDTNVASQM